MSEEDESTDFELAEQDLRKAMLELCKITGKPGQDLMKDETVFRSFCGKNASQVKKMVSGNSARICDECIDYAQKLIGGEEV